MRIRDLAAVACLCAATFLCLEGGLFVMEARKRLPIAINQLDGTLSDYSRLAQDSTGVTAELRKTLKASQDSSKQIAQNSAIATVELDADLGALGNAIANLNQLILTVGDQSRGLSASGDTALRSISDTMDSLHPAILKLSESADALPPIMENIRQTSANSASTTQNIDASSHDIQQFIHRETTPVRGTWNVIKGFLTTFAGPAASVATAIK